jgi:hypothetical protein
MKRLLKNWVIRNFPKQVEVKTETLQQYDIRTCATIYVKKGKMREWRSFDKNGKRLPEPVFFPDQGQKKKKKRA